MMTLKYDSNDPTSMKSKKKLIYFINYMQVPRNLELDSIFICLSRDFVLGLQQKYYYLVIQVCK